MGEVYRCRDTRVPRTTVALKVLAPAVADDPDFRRRFTREAQIIAGLNHPHICALYDVGDHDGTSFIVMPLLEGQSLAERLRGDPIPLAEALRVAVAVASALTHAHARGVLHRDVKPANIMLGADGSVKLVDFGIARSAAAASTAGDAGSEASTRSTHLLGTLEYMSPEQIAGRSVDERSDVFSLGVVLYEMVSGRHPFRGAERALTACAILDCKYAPIVSSDPRVQAVDALLAMVLSHDPDARGRGMTEFLKELEFLQQTVEPERSDRKESRRRVWSPRTLAAAFGGTAAIVLLAMMLGGGFAGFGGEPADAGSPPPANARADETIGARPPGARAGGPVPAYYSKHAAKPAAPAGDVREIGVTVWRLRRATPQDTVRLLVHETNAAKEEWTPERIELDTPLADGDRVRVTIESPRAGYLYVIDRERYADGSTGVPHVIFPTMHTSQGDNRVASGRLVDIPSQSDRPPYFTLRASRPDQTGELLTVIVSDQPLAELTPGAEPLQITPAAVESWEKRGSPTLVEHLELAGGAGRAWSKAEQLAAADATRVLTQSAPPPQTVFRIVTSEPGWLVAQVVLGRHSSGGFNGRQ
jgi:hypothetical protein